jgi:D-alanyl-D-alanine carboxypeptidase
MLRLSFFSVVLLCVCTAPMSILADTVVKSAAARIDPAALAKTLSTRLEAAADAGFSGSVLVADRERILFEKCFGQADPKTGRPVQSDTRFNLASAGKLFTIVAIMQLVEQGRLDLDAPVGRYLSDWPVASVRDQVTARQLLMHTSGLGAYWGGVFEARRSRLRTLSDYLPLLATEPGFAPGSAWQYSNSGYMLLGLLIEAISGEDYYDYVARHVFAPAGMVDSGYFEVDGRADNVATPHVGGTGANHRETFRMPEPRGGGAGGGYSTPRDLMKFHRALIGGELLSANTLELLFEPVTLPAGTRAPPHGLGILRYAIGSDVAYGHPGGAEGVGVEFRAARGAGLVVIVMSNTNEPRTMPLAFELFGLIAEAGGADLRSTMPSGPRPSSARSVPADPADPGR